MRRCGRAQRTRDRQADPEFAERWLAESRKSREFAACGNPSYFDQIDTPDKAYWLGFIATDGMVTGFKSGSLRLVIKLARKDRAHLEVLHPRYRPSDLSATRRSGRSRPARTSARSGRCPSWMSARRNW